ncbi:MAG: prolipoprotein diacylglyceryl transferase [Nanoarchaeota archaeon]|nr:prolipoprotein diacylglyceryl transferase [Nanoarchaeota archaeon]MBU1031143.1 prolipoprotein diacylglyceryl transferase [Nanoarchaeota archaeon]MBU1850146.1 prolipoprotein diacylglyceryl transferase [Nanoarchaeota archaeon]
MFIHNINPVLLKIGFLEIRYYSLVYILGFLLVYFILYKTADKKKIKNLTKEAVDDFITYLIIGLIVGARIFHFIFYNPQIIWTKPLEILMVWHGGMSFHGGLIGIIIAYLIFHKKHKVAFYDLADLLVIPAAFTLFLGRIANFINGELWGTITTVFWCVKFKRADGCRHPSQLYEAAKNLIIFGVLCFMKENQAQKKKQKKGILFWTFVLLYGVLRFIVNFWRDDPRFFGISTGQILSFVMIVVALVFLYKLKKTNH